MKPSELAPSLQRVAELLTVVRAMAGDASTQAAKLSGATEYNQPELAEKLRGALAALSDVAAGRSCPDAAEKLRRIADNLSRESSSPAATAVISIPTEEPPPRREDTIEKVAKTAAINIAIDHETAPISAPRPAEKSRQRRDTHQASDRPEAEHRRTAVASAVQRRKCIDPNCTWVGAAAASAKCPTCGKSTIKLR